MKNADGTYTTIKEGSFSADNAADTVDLGKEYKGYGFRLTAVSTQNGQNFAAAVEMNIGLTKKSEQVTAAQHHRGRRQPVEEGRSDL